MRDGARPATSGAGTSGGGGSQPAAPRFVPALMLRVNRLHLSVSVNELSGEWRE